MSISLNDVVFLLLTLHIIATAPQPEDCQPYIHDELGLSQYITGLPRGTTEPNTPFFFPITSCGTRLVSKSMPKRMVCRLTAIERRVLPLVPTAVIPGCKLRKLANDFSALLLRLSQVSYVRHGHLRSANILIATLKDALTPICGRK